MNINKQAEIEELFKKINKRTYTVTNSKVTPEELNKIRAHIVQSQRPLQQVRLLKKEREEREVDEMFTTQKEMILHDAKVLDTKRQKYKEEQQAMIKEVSMKTHELQTNSLKRMAEEEKLRKECATIEDKQRILNERQQILLVKKAALAEREDELKKNVKYSQFLDKVVADKSGDKEGFSDIQDLQNRFRSLKKENSNLLSRKQQIDNELKACKNKEKEKLNKMKTYLYEQQRKMASVQLEVEKVSHLNSQMEQEFEFEIEKKNKYSKEQGQIINSINNVFNICKVQQEFRKKKFAAKEDVLIKEGVKGLGELLNGKLDKIAVVVDELAQVFDEYGGDYNQERAYAEQIEAALEQKAPGAKYGSYAASRQRQTGATSNVDRDGDGMTMKTSKLTSGMTRQGL